MRLNRIIFLLLITITGLHCKKNNNGSTTPDTAGTITISLPTTGSIYDNGFGLQVSGEMTDNNVLATAKVEIRNKTTGAILFQQTTATGNVSLYRFLWNWTVSGITSPITATVKVIAIDTRSNQVSKEVDVTLTN